MKRYPLTLTLFLLVSLSSLARGATYYVAQDSAGTGDGTSYANRASVSAHNAGGGVFADLDGDTVRLCGIVSSGVIVPDGGRSGNYVTYESHGSDPAVLTARSSSGAFYATQKDYLIIDGLNVRDGRIGMYFANDTDYLTIKNCAVHNMTGSASKGILITGSNQSIV